MGSLRSTRHYFRPQERLKSSRHIRYLFQEGKTRYFSSFRLHYVSHPLSERCHQALFLVPKKHFRKSFTRYRIRRLLREAHRQHKYILQSLAMQGTFLLISYTYTGPVAASYAQIAEQVATAIHFLSQSYTQHALPSKTN